MPALITEGAGGIGAAADLTGHPGPDRRRIVEAGDIELRAGASAHDLPLPETVRLTGTTRVVDSDRRFMTTAATSPSRSSA